MTITDALREKNITKAELCRRSGVAWATLSDICSGKSDLSRVSVLNAIRIAGALQMTVEELFAIPQEEVQKNADRVSFEQFKGNTCHRLKQLGDIDFLIEVIESDEIHALYDRRWLPESLYLLAMTDYLCRRNHMPLCTDYDDLRGRSLRKPLYPLYAQLLYMKGKDTSAMRACRKKAIPEFLHHNIIESDIDNVV